MTSTIRSSASSIPSGLQLMTHRSSPLVASLFVPVFGLLLGLASSAAAAPPAGVGPEEQACVGRAIGDACTLPNNQLGTCAQATCSRLDYSGGSPPRAVEEPCIACKPAGAQPHDGPPMLGGDGGASPEAGDGTEPSPSGSESDNKEPPESKSRCRLDPSDPSPAGLALLAGLLLILRRRRSV
ncbi:MAG: MYXO-CTERM sorting domain-containing protein [Enhygromyxa sp.]